MIALGLAACLAPQGDSKSSVWRAEDYFDGPAVQLAEAAQRGDTAEVRRLIREKGVNPDEIFDKDAMPLLAWPIVTGSPEGLRALLENGADPNARAIDQSLKRGQNRNNAMVLAAGLPNPAYLKLLLDNGGDPNTRNSNDETLLFEAFIKQNQWQNIQLLIERGADINLPVYGRHDTVAGWYSARSGFDKVYWLLEHGADPTLKMPSGRMPIVEEIYWQPARPEQIEWQRKCQRWLRDRGIARPEKMPQGIRTLREAAGLATDEKDIPLL